MVICRLRWSVAIPSEGIRHKFCTRSASGQYVQGAWLRDGITTCTRYIH